MIRISSIEVKNFKSLVDFKIDLAKFSCLIGLNGSGKSTVLQFLDFLSQLIRGDIKEWLENRNWKSTDLKSKLSRKVNIEFCVWLENAAGESAGRWNATYSPSKNRCTNEHITLLDHQLVVEAGNLQITNLAISQDTRDTKYERNDKITFDYEGSILSALKEELLPIYILQFKNALAGVKSLDLLAPEHLRHRSRASSGSLGLGGQNLSAFLYEMPTEKQYDLLELLKKVYPQLQGLHAKPLRSGWKQIEINESFEGAESGFFPAMVTEARHINDGMLRLIAILAELQSEHGFLLFDEIENGINPELIEFVLDELVTSPKQIMVTTHSPMILNYLEDDVAQSGVIYLYKTPDGHTHSIPFFSIPSLAKKLTVMGPGEVFVDTNLTDLYDEIKAMPEIESTLEEQ